MYQFDTATDEISMHFDPNLPHVSNSSVDKLILIFSASLRTERRSRVAAVASPRADGCRTRSTAAPCCGGEKEPGGPEE